MDLTTVVVRTHHLIFLPSQKPPVVQIESSLLSTWKKGNTCVGRDTAILPQPLTFTIMIKYKLLSYHFLLTQEKKPARVWQPPKPREEPAPSQPIPARRNNISTPTTTTHISPVKQQQAPTQSKTWMYQPPTVTKSQPAPVAKSPVQERKEEMNVLPAAARAHLR